MVEPSSLSINHPIISTVTIPWPYYQVGDHSPWWSLPPSPIGQSRSRSLSASQTSLARCSITLSYQKPNLSWTLSIRIQKDLLHTKVWFKTFLLIFWFKNVSAASPGWVASSPTSSPPVAQKPGFWWFSQIQNSGDGTNGAITFWIRTRKLRPF